MSDEIVTRPVTVDGRTVWAPDYATAEDIKQMLGMDGGTQLAVVHPNGAASMATPHQPLQLSQGDRVETVTRYRGGGEDAATRWITYNARLVAQRLRCLVDLDTVAYSNALLALYWFPVNWSMVGGLWVGFSEA